MTGDFKAISRVLRESRADIDHLHTELMLLKSQVVYKPTTEPLEQRRFIHDVIDELYDRQELRSLIFEIAERERLKTHGRNDEIVTLSYESLPGESKSEVALELVLFMRRHGRYSMLKKILNADRDFVDWDLFR